MRAIQAVHLGQTQSGIFGYFTGNMLAFSLSAEDYARPAEWHVSNCHRLRFAFYSRLR